MLLDGLNALFDGGTLAVGDKVRIPDEIRAKIPQLANVPEIGEITGVEGGAYTAEFGEVRLQGLAEDFVPVEATATGLADTYSGRRVGEPFVRPVPVGDRRLAGFPAQIDRLAVASRRESRSAQVDILNDAAERLDAMDQPVRFRIFSSPKRGGGNGDRTPARRGALRPFGVLQRPGPIPAA